jgi:hypothetical protein
MANCQIKKTSSRTSSRCVSHTPFIPIPNLTRSQERKYFDSGDYALSKAGKASDIGVTQIGREHPVPENIPHSTTSPHNLHNGHTLSPSPGTIPTGSLAQGGSPVKEGSYLQRETSASEIENENVGKPEGEAVGGSNIDLEQGSEHARLKPVAIQK